MAIKNIIFDIGRVLIGFEWMDYIHSMFDEETCKAVTKAMWLTRYWHELDRAVIPEEEILEMFYSAAPAYKKEIKQAFDNVGKCIIRRPYAADWIDSYKERGFHVYFLSNYSEHLMKVNPQAIDFISHMDGGVFSCDVKAIKPDPKIYKDLLDKYDLQPDECLFLDDQEPNVLKARELGIHAVQYFDYDQVRAEIEKEIESCNGEAKNEI